MATQAINKEVTFWRKMGQESMCYENYIIELLLILISFSMPKV
jgi:hypothetical protein